MTKAQRIIAAIFTCLAAILFVKDWSKFGFTGTATAGAGAIMMHCFTYAFSGAIVAGFVGLLVSLSYKFFTGKYRFPYTVFLCIWGFILFGSLYANFYL